MKTFELHASAANAPYYAYYSGDNGIDAMLFGDLDAITDEPLILMSKKDFEEHLASQEGRMDLPTDTKVMVQERIQRNWVFALYKGKGFAKPDFRYPKDGLCTTYKHVIPYSLFDPGDPDRWNGTENDYGTEGGAR